VGHVAQMEVPRIVARAVLGLLDAVEAGGSERERRLSTGGRVRPVR
jgi:hypothetical protein